MNRRAWARKVVLMEVPTSSIRDRAAIFTLVLLATAGGMLLLWSRIVPMNLSLWQDEVYTVTQYVEAGPRAIVFGDWIPNNHILFNLLTWLASEAAGHAEWVFRFWSVVPGVLAVVVTIIPALRRSDWLVAVSTGILLATSPVMTQYSVQARGYGICLLSMAFLYSCGDVIARRRDNMAVAVFCIAGTAGVMTLPVFLLPFTLACTVLFVQVPKSRKAISIGLAVSGVAAFLLYLPNLKEVILGSQQRFGEPISALGVITQPFLELVAPSMELLIPGAAPFSSHVAQSPTVQIIATASGLFLAALGFAHVWCRLQTEALLLVVPIFGTTFVLFVMGAFIADRFVSFLSIPLLVLVGEGVGTAVGMLKTRPRLHLAGGTVAALIALMVFVSFHRAAEPILEFPRENFKQVAQVVKSAPEWPIISNSVRPIGFEYYVDREIEFIPEPRLLEERLCTGGPLIFIHHPLLAPDYDFACLERNGVSCSRVYQRSRGGWIDIWLIPKSAR